MPHSETLEIHGHVIDSMLFTRILDQVLEAHADYVIERFDVGRTPTDASYARLQVTTEDPTGLEELVQSLMGLGMTRVHTGEATLVPAEIDGVLPDGFYSSTNLETEVRVGERWLRVDNPEMDCAIVVAGGRARTVPMADVLKGEPVVVGSQGIRVRPRDRGRGGEVFEFMSSQVSSEKPQGLIVSRVAAAMRATRERGERILWVAGPAVVHTGAGPAVVRLIEAGYMDVLFAGNALATHDIEGALYGTSLGVNLSEGIGVEHGHEHHIRALNTIRRCGSIAKAVEQGVLTSGIMHACVVNGVDVVLGGSVRDDGPLPDTITDVLDAQRQMRSLLPGVGYALMVATMLHSIATGNLLPASVPLVCVDINPATVTKLADRGSAQATGVVTDVGLFLAALAGELTR
ncbi:MAG TPA: TIGR00300 family protein [Actinomycetes bacterium]|jgi:lysine-ketoglutarate reductase/saccharopine dehydrogenase-like protein (TIGR00300 family)|nr:TIGR00300 family protein [Actinomycetes bacterium]